MEDKVQYVDEKGQVVIDGVSDHRFLIKLFTFRRVRGESSKEMIEKIESSGSIRATFSSTLHDCSLDGEVRCSNGETNEML